MSAQQKPVLEVSNLSARYGKVGALVGATLTVPAGSIVTVIGANGAGKSTMLNAVMGSLPHTGHAAGAVHYSGTDVSGWQVERAWPRACRWCRSAASCSAPCRSRTICCWAVSAATARVRAAGATR